MTALLVMLTIVFLVALDYAKLGRVRAKTNRLLASDPGAILEPGLGLCMCDGVPAEEEKEKKG